MTTSEEQAEQPPYPVERELSPPRPHPALQRATDKLVSAVFLWAFPRWIRPNHLTLLRFILIPVVLVLLALHLDWWALGVFVFATCSDFIDGAMARTRDQITVLGTYIDPVADKLLVASVLAYVGYHYLVVQLMLALIFLELILTAVGARILLQTRSARPANVYGKIKMIFHSVALYLFLLGGILGLKSWMSIGSYLLWPALGLALMSGSKQIFSVRLSARSNRETRSREKWPGESGC
jgi:CDP-diacylglycerol--glycerol-3-phosphate 3-phosphatidyltransferase